MKKRKIRHERLHQPPGRGSYDDGHVGHEEDEGTEEETG